MLNLTETKSRITKTVTASTGEYNLTATATIEDGKIVSLNGNVVNSTSAMMAEPMNIHFDAYRSGDELKVNYHNIASDERETLDIISAMVDAVVAMYETAA